MLDRLKIPEHIEKYMQKILGILAFGTVSLLCMVHDASAKEVEVPYTLEDRDRLIRMEVFIKGIENRMDGIEKRMDGIEKRMDGIEKRMDGIEKRMDGIEARIERLESVMMWGFGLLFTSMLWLMGFVLWDRRSALAPAVRKSKELEERGERVERALKEMAYRDPKIAEALKQVGLL